MASRYFLPILAALGVVLGVIAIIMSQRTPPAAPIPFPPPSPPFAHFVAGQGLIEAASEDIFIGAPFSEIIEHVYVTAGDLVVKDDPLFQLNTDSLMAKLDEAKAQLKIAEAEYQKQIDLPRPEDIPPQNALVNQAEARLLDKTKQFEIVDLMENPKAISRDEYNQRKYGALFAKYQLEEATERLNLLLAGAWIRDLEISKNQVKEAKARVATVETDIERSIIRAPMEGQVLRVNVRVGQFAQASELTTPLMIFGSSGWFHIRVDIDEEDAWRVIKGAPGVAYMRGNRNIHVPLTYIRLEPYLIPKQALTGENTERVDTRVLQLIYEMDQKDLPIYPGMLMDAYLEAKPTAGAK